MSYTDIEETNALFKEHFPNAVDLPQITIMRDGFAALELQSGITHLRPGGMVNGPTQMALADTIAYACIFTKLGPTMMAATTSLNIHFLRPCIGPLIRAEATMIRISKTMAVIDVRIFGEGHVQPSAVGTVSYALPKA